MPLENPFNQFKKQLDVDLRWLSEQDIETFHAYSFATLRQFGACFELAALYLNWLSEQGESGLDKAYDNFQFLSEQAKVFQFQLARAVSRGKSLDSQIINHMAVAWTEAFDILKNKYL